MYDFANLKTDLRRIIFPGGEAPNLRVAHDKAFIEALVDLQQTVECLQYDNTQLIPQCATYYNCGLTVLPAPRGRIKKLSVVDSSAQTVTAESGVPESAVTVPSLAAGWAFYEPAGFLIVKDASPSASSTGSIEIAAMSGTLFYHWAMTGGTIAATMTNVSKVTITPINGTTGDPVIHEATDFLNGNLFPSPYLMFTSTVDGQYRIDVEQSAAISNLATEGTDLSTKTLVQINSSRSGFVVISEPSITPETTTVNDWCSEIEYRQVDACHIQKYLTSCQQAGCCLSPMFFGLAPVPTDEGVSPYLPTLPLGYHYPQTSTDSPRRAFQGIWAIERGKIFVAPWIQSTETIILKWDGIKREWGDTDAVPSDPKLKLAVQYWVLKDHAMNYDRNMAEAQMFEAQYRQVRSELWEDCREETRVRRCEPSQARASSTGISDGGGSGSGDFQQIFYNTAQTSTAECQVGYSGSPKTVTIPAGTVGSTISVDDANNRAKVMATAQAEAQLACTPSSATIWNEPQSYTASCTGEVGAPEPTGDEVTVTIPSGTYSAGTQAAANALALAEAQRLAEDRLVCVFHNRSKTVTVECPDGSTGNGPQSANVAASTVSCDRSTQALADQAATDLARQLALDLLTCTDNGDPVPTTYPNAEQIVSRQEMLPTHGGVVGFKQVTVTAPAGLWFAADPLVASQYALQAAQDALNYYWASTIAFPGVSNYTVTP